MSWDTVQQYRLAMEKLVLEQELPGFAFYDPTGRTYVSGNWRSNSGKYYGLHVQLTAGFPDESPSLYITSPSPLYGYAYRKTIASYGANHDMHTWTSERPGWGNGCTCHALVWSAGQSLVEVI